MQLDQPTRATVINNLSQVDREDLLDQVPSRSIFPDQQDDYLYFDTPDELYDHLVSHVVPLAKPWLAAEIVGHEVAHTDCALALGATGIKYSVSLDKSVVPPAFAHIQTSSPLPNLAHAAIAMHPYNSARSMEDVRTIGQSGYTSRDHVIARIERWNSHDNGLVIPMPRSEPLFFTPRMI